jgi:hypothetical protein
MDPVLNGRLEGVEHIAPVLEPTLGADSTKVVAHSGCTEAESLPNLSVRAAFELER